MTDKEHVQNLQKDDVPLPPVSVIMAVYNGERYLAEAVESVLGQSHEDFEFVIVDDGSTDRTPKILDFYAARDGRVRVISQTNAGQPASLNRAHAEARNEWVAVLDADGACMPHRLETQLRALRREPSVRVLGASAFWTNEWGGTRGIRAFGPKSLKEFERLAAGRDPIVIVHPTAMMHRATILKLGGYAEDFGPAADVELWSRVSDEHPVISLSEPLLYYRIHTSSMSVTRFFEQRLLARWIRARQHARRRGLSQPTLDEYRKRQESPFTLRCLNYRRKDWGQYLITRSVLAWWTGYRSRALLLRAAALALVPLQTASRVRTPRPGSWTAPQ